MKRSPSENQEETTHRQLDKEDTKEASTKKSLPSRSEIHQHKRKQEQLRRRRTKNPLLQVLLLFFLLLPIVAYSVYSNYMNRDHVKGEEPKANEEVTVMEENKIAKKPESRDDSMEENEVNEQQEEENQEEKEPPSKENNTAPPPVQQPPAVKEPKPVKEENPKQQLEQKPVQPQQEQKTEEKQEGKTTTHTVQQGETLFRISMKYYNSQAGIEKIRQANGISGNDINVGQVLKIPLP